MLIKKIFFSTLAACFLLPSMATAQECTTRVVLEKPAPSGVVYSIERNKNFVEHTLAIGLENHVPQWEEVENSRHTYHRSWDDYQDAVCNLAEESCPLIAYATKDGSPSYKGPELKIDPGHYRIVFHKSHPPEKLSAYDQVDTAYLFLDLYEGIDREFIIQSSVCGDITVSTMEFRGRGMGMLVGPGWSAIKINYDLSIKK